MNCKVCNSSNNIEVQHKAHKCSNCSHVYINYTDDGILYHKSLYRSEGEEGNRGSGEVLNGRFTEQFHNRRENICNNRVKYIQEYFNSCNTLLDIGAGGGTFLNKVSKYFKKVEATEVSDLCVENLIADGYSVYPGPFTKTIFTNTYDLVTCWHVLEHIEDLKSFVEKAYQITNKHLVIEVPIKRTLRNPDVNFDGHFHYFSERSMKILFEDYFNISYIGDGVQMPCLLVKMDKK
jgi:hypothetical protein